MTSTSQSTGTLRVHDYLERSSVQNLRAGATREVPAAAVMARKVRLCIIIRVSSRSGNALPQSPHTAGKRKRDRQLAVPPVSHADTGYAAPRGQSHQSDR